ncbi:50S ribosomal protein L16 [Candidatus Dojkabacteria bacterium]|nr:50S ribosomal protein L16 [Candidatus Dojkabacteria bacterium]
MLQPKQRKHKKEHRGKMRGLSYRGSELAYGDFGIQTTEKAWVKAREIEAARKTIVNYTARKGKLWIKIFPHKPYTKKSDEVVRGSGKGEVSMYVAVVKPGRILFEIGGLPENVAKEALKLATAKLSVKTRIVSKDQLN